MFRHPVVTSGLLSLLLFTAAAAVSLPAAAPEAVVKSLMTKELRDLPGKEALMLSVEYPPGGTDPVHRHFAHAFVYVLEGSILMQVNGGKQVTLRAGDTFYEGPDDIHVVGRNASATAPARFVVVLLKRAGAPLFEPAP